MATEDFFEPPIRVQEFHASMVLVSRGLVSYVRHPKAPFFVVMLIFWVWVLLLRAKYHFENDEKAQFGMDFGVGMLTSRTYGHA